MSAGKHCYIIPVAPSAAGIKDCYLMTLFSLGKASIVSLCNDRHTIYGFQHFVKCNRNSILGKPT